MFQFHFFIEATDGGGGDGGARVMTGGGQPPPIGAATVHTTATLLNLKLPDMPSDSYSGVEGHRHCWHISARAVQNVEKTFFPCD